MTQGSSQQLGPTGPGGDELQDALTRYSGFLAHQLAELSLLLSAAGDGGPAAAARLRLERMLRDLRDLQPVPGEMRDVDLAAVLKDLATELSEPRRQARVSVVGARLPVHGDAALLQALLGHLMRAGLAAAGGTVRFTLSTAARDDGRVQVDLLEAGRPERVAGASDRLAAFGRPEGSGSLLGAGVSGPAAARIVAAHGGLLEVDVAGVGVLTTFDLPAAGR